MSVLSDYTIASCIDSGHIGIDPFVPEHIQPASIDLRIGDRFSYFEMGSFDKIDVRESSDHMMRYVECTEDAPFILHPGQFALARTVERVRLPDDITARLDGKSSLGRLGLVIHSTAGWIDPGFEGTITLELSNSAPLPITLYPQMFIGQLSFMRMDRRVTNPYQGKYQGQTEPTASKMHENFWSPEQLGNLGSIIPRDHEFDGTTDPPRPSWLDGHGLDGEGT